MRTDNDNKIQAVLDCDPIIAKWIQKARASMTVNPMDGTAACVPSNSRMGASNESVTCASIALGIRSCASILPKAHRM